MADHPSGVAWREWGEDSFAEARAQDKPVLLDIGAVWCHWCHVMDTGIPGDPNHTGTYSDPDVQRRIAAEFVPIKVDNDRRPDINARYNMGGWPTTAFLTPEGETLYGETYVPPGRMVALLDHIAGLWRTQRDEIRAQTAQARTQRAADDQPPPAAELDPNTVATVTAALKRNFDSAYGGFGTHPKFPHPDALLFALEQHARTGDAELREVAVKTMRGMAGGGMYDQYAGGFFRYSTTRDWSVPHFEKMLEDNAKLTRVYAFAAQLLGDESLMDTVRSAHGWLLSDMRDPATGAFAGSQDADKEEAYYGQPLSARATMPMPYIDRTVYAGWNALMVSSLVARYEVTGETDILATAQQAQQFLYDKMSVYYGKATERDSCQVLLAVRHFHADGRPQGSVGLLSDQTSFLSASLDLHEATGLPIYKRWATETADYTLALLEDRVANGFFDLSPEPDAVGELAHPKKEMGDNADAALALLRLAALTDDLTYREAAERALKCFAGEYAQISYFAASYARAAQAASAPPLHLVIVGAPDDPRSWQLRQAAWNVAAPGKAVETVGPGDAEGRGYPPGDDGSPRAYVCVGTRCLAPAPDAEALRERVREALAL